jgi:hypothetical protein
VELYAVTSPASDKP